MLEFQKGNKASFEKLMNIYYARILNFIFRFVGQRAVAEDLTQEVFIKVYQCVNVYKPRSKFSTWIFTIAKNISLNELRKVNRQPVSFDETFSDEEGHTQARQVADEKTDRVDIELIRLEKIKTIKKAIMELPENQRMAVILRRYEDFSYEDIAQTLNCSVEAVKSLLSRAKESLKNKLSGLKE